MVRKAGQAMVWEARMKRAITLAGGGPAAGLHIGALEGLQKAGIHFDVWALSCIGAWVGIIYNQWENGDKAQQTYDFFHNGVFRDDESYSRFPVNTVFGPDLGGNTNAVVKFLSNPTNYDNLLLPSKIADAFRESMSFWSDSKNWSNAGDINHWMLDQVLAVHPFSRFLTSLMYLSPVSGLSRIYYPDSSFLKAIKFENLFKLERTFVYHNAWNLDKGELQLFSNIKTDKYKNISAQSLCACSALPFIEETVTIDNEIYCEGALIDTVNFSRLIEDHPDLNEIWVSRIVDVEQVRAPKNIKDALGNLCMLFAGALGNDDVKLFKYHAKDEGWQGTIYEIEVAKHINFDWTHSNLEDGRAHGRDAVAELLNFYYFLQCYLDKNMKGAAVHANKLTRKDYPLGLVAKAVTSQATGAMGEAQEAIDRLLKTDQAWQKYPHLELGKTIYEPATLDRLMKDLRAAGLPVSQAKSSTNHLTGADRARP
jgi:predicted acylesterase/phospholipase RssA